MMNSALSRTLITVLAATFAVLGLSVSTTSAQAAEAAVEATPTLDTATYETRVLYWINRQRVNHGLPKVRPESCTDSVAEDWGSFLARTLEFFHQDLGNLNDRCNAKYAGETLAKGPVGPRQMVKLWMNSDGHRHILLSEKPRRIGIGAYVDQNGSWVVAADFTRF